MYFKNIYDAGDKAEDKVRRKLSHYPLVYAFVGGVGIVLFWRGVWHTIDFLMEYFFAVEDEYTIASTTILPWWDGPLSLVVGSILMLMVGLFVTSLIGNEIILSGLKKEKKITEKTEEELEFEIKENEKTIKAIHEMDKRLRRMEVLIKK